MSSSLLKVEQRGVRPQIICIVGPTGTGKTQAAIALAERIRGEVVNCDSRQVYRDFPVITAQPTGKERSQCPHWLYGFLESWERVDAGTFSSQACQVIDHVLTDQGMPILVGGTGLYLKSILYGLAQIPDIPEEIRNRVCQDYSRLGPDHMHAWLETVDPEASVRIHARDRQRITRALEVYLATGKPLSEWQNRSRMAEPRFDACQIGLWTELEQLTPGLESRIDRMLSGSALEEVRAAWSRCPDESAPGWSGIGCRELLQVHLGRLSLPEAREMWLKNTRAYAKRQMTWFKKHKGLMWLRPGHMDALKRMVDQWLEQR